MQTLPLSECQIASGLTRGVAASFLRASAKISAHVIGDRPADLLGATVDDGSQVDEPLPCVDPRGAADKLHPWRAKYSRMVFRAPTQLSTGAPA